MAHSTNYASIYILKPCRPTQVCNISALLDSLPLIMNTCAVHVEVGRFGRHAADAMKWSGGRGRCWSPPGHRPGWYHLRKWSSTGKLRRLNAPRGCTAQARSGSSGLPSEPSFPEDVARQAASFAFRGMEIGELAVYHAAADGRKVGGSRKVPSVSTLSIIQEQEPTSGWSCG